MKLNLLFFGKYLKCAGKLMVRDTERKICSRNSNLDQIRQINFRKTTDVFGRNPERAMGMEDELRINL